MIQSYCNYGIYNEDTSQCMEDGDCVDSLTYCDGEKFVTVEDVRIVKITKDKIMVETDDFEEIEISIEDIDNWD